MTVSSATGTSELSLETTRADSQTRRPPSRRFKLLLGVSRDPAISAGAAPACYLHAELRRQVLRSVRCRTVDRGRFFRASQTSRPYRATWSERGGDASVTTQPAISSSPSSGSEGCGSTTVWSASGKWRSQGRAGIADSSARAPVQTSPSRGNSSVPTLVALCALLRASEASAGAAHHPAHRRAEAACSSLEG